MKVAIKTYLFTVGALLLLIGLIIYRYEKLLAKTPAGPGLERVAGGAPAMRHFTAAEMITLIKNSKAYLGDSITILDNGQVHSNNYKFQGTINAVVNSRANMDIVQSQTGSNNLPIQYNIYVLAAQYYRDQYHLAPTEKSN